MTDAETPTRDLLSAEDDDALLSRLKDWFQPDHDHFLEWKDGEEGNGGATEDFDFVADRQWSEEDRQILAEQNRPASGFNRVGPMIDSVCGFQVSNRTEIRFIPRKQGDVGVNEMLTSAGDWFRDQAHAEDEESDAFRDMVICGRGAVEMRVDYETNPDGAPVIERTDPFEVFPDYASRKPNHTDAKRVWRIRTMPEDEALAMFPEADPAVLHAGWAAGKSGDITRNNPGEAYDEKSDREPGSGREVTIVECQWFEREPFTRFIDGMTGEEVTVTQEQFEILAARLAQMTPDDMMMMGIAPPQQVVQQYRRVYRRAFIGQVVLEVKETPIPGHFTYKFMTGKRDHNKGHFYGLVRPMKDPQRWTNKLFSQIMHILNSNAKGGIMAERGAFEDDNDASESWAKSEAITWLERGGIAKIQPKPTTALPQGQADMLQFSMSTMPLITGVNLEMLGMRDANQPGIVETQRRQAGITILQPYFDGLRHYYKSHGEALLLMIQQYLSDGRLVKIVGPEYEQYLPLRREFVLGEYDVVVDEAPTSPNARERNWAVIQSMISMIAPTAQANPPLMAQLFKLSPLPENLANGIADILMQAPPPPPPEQLEIMAIQKAAEIAKIDKDAASAEKSRADAMARQAATAMSVLPAIMANVSPNLPPAPVPSGPLPGLPFQPGSMTPPDMPMQPPMPPQMPPRIGPDGRPAPMPVRPDMPGRTNLPPPPGLVQMPNPPGQF